ncbi:MAG: prepilin peptidase [bacterium]|nr:prepilin peptidase [bacterium]
MIKLYALVLGLIGGSFINALLWRIPRNKNISFERSECVKCGHKLGFLDLIPVLSFIFLLGKCRYCNKKISWQYPLIELVSGLGLYFLASKFNGAEFIWLAGIFLLSVFIFVYDLKNLIILNGSIFLGAIWVVFGLWFFQVENFENNILMALVIFSFFFAQYFLSKGKWVGGGDAKLGLFLGLWLGWPVGLIGLLFAYILGSAVGIPLLIFRLVNLKSKIPFGPFLITGAWVAYLWGDAVLRWYEKLLLVWF